jgi:hypothetical protein
LNLASGKFPATFGWHGSGFEHELKKVSQSRTMTGGFGDLALKME